MKSQGLKLKIAIKSGKFRWAGQGNIKALYFGFQALQPLPNRQ